MRILAILLAVGLLSACTGPVSTRTISQNPTFDEPDKQLPVVAGPLGQEPDKVLPTTRATAEPQPTPAPPSVSASSVEAAATQILASLQRQSINEAREYCGYIVQTATGQIAATRATPGTLASCYNQSPAGAGRVLASYHTHGRFDRGYDNEVPSPNDMVGDFTDRIDGYISTPGGRLWHVDYETRQAYQLCRSCIPADPNAQEIGPPVRQTYTLAQIRAR